MKMATTLSKTNKSRQLIVRHFVSLNDSIFESWPIQAYFFMAMTLYDKFHKKKSLRY